jgi:hypothetical protein
MISHLSKIIVVVLPSISSSESLQLNLRITAGIAKNFFFFPSFAQYFRPIIDDVSECNKRREITYCEFLRYRSASSGPNDKFRIFHTSGLSIPIRFLYWCSISRWSLLTTRHLIRVAKRGTWLVAWSRSTGHRCSNVQYWSTSWLIDLNVDLGFHSVTTDEQAL